MVKRNLKFFEDFKIRILTKTITIYSNSITQYVCILRKKLK
ncbi:hypothetical protein MSHRCOH1_04955 [Candidatus Ornithobacterium hominis]|nr:hypothetical protein MSHRCOH1_04955 [Candidatus Ornithobacterium hominis]